MKNLKKYSDQDLINELVSRDNSFSTSDQPKTVKSKSTLKNSDKEIFEIVKMKVIEYREFVMNDLDHLTFKEMKSKIEKDVLKDRFYNVSTDQKINFLLDYFKDEAQYWEKFAFDLAKANI